MALRKGKPRKKSKAKSKPILVPGTRAHEAAVKKILKGNVSNTLDMLNKLGAIEAKQLKIGNAFTAFRFRRGLS